MRDKDIDDLLNEFDNSVESFFINKNIDTLNDLKVEEIIKIIRRKIHLEYLETELKLIKQIESIDFGDKIFYNITDKGRRILRKGGWIKYIKTKSIKKKTSYFIGIITPIITSIIALLSISLNIQQQKYMQEKNHKQELLEEKMEVLNKNISTLKYLENQNVVNDTLSKKKN